MGDKSEEQKAEEAAKNIEIWKIKKLIKSLEAARGCAEAVLSECRELSQLPVRSPSACERRALCKC